MTENDRRQQILDGALEVFARDGFHKASIKQIAKAAGIKSSALIYHYFEDKRALLNAIIAEQPLARDLPMLNPQRFDELLGLPPEIVLRQIGLMVVGLTRDEKLMRVVRVVISEAARVSDVAEFTVDIQLNLLSFIEQYMAYQMEQGRLKQADSQQVARAFIGMVIVNLFGNALFPPLIEGFGDPEAYMAQAVEIFLNGLKDETP